MAPMPRLPRQVPTHLKDLARVIKHAQLLEQLPQQHKRPKNDATVAQRLHQHHQLTADRDTGRELLLTEVLNDVQNDFFDHVAGVPPFVIAFDDSDICGWILPQIAMDHLVDLYIVFSGCG